MTTLGWIPVALAAVVFSAAPDGGPRADRATRAVHAEPPAIVGLDHIAIAVQDLETAARRYRELGFALKPGRPHPNGIRNQHVKFPDGSELELITAPEARDALTAAYRRHLAGGDGPAFAGFYAPAMNRAAQRLDAAGIAYRRSAGLLTFPDTGGLGHLFVGQRNRAATDRPEHFAHRNSAAALAGAWLAGDDLSAEHGLLVLLGARLGEQRADAPARRGGPAPGRRGRLSPGRQAGGAGPGGSSARRSACAAWRRCDVPSSAGAGPCRRRCGARVARASSCPRR